MTTPFTTINGINTSTFQHQGFAPLPIPKKTWNEEFIDNDTPFEWEGTTLKIVHTYGGGHPHLFKASILERSSMYDIVLEDQTKDKSEGRIPSCLYINLTAYAVKGVAFRVLALNSFGEASQLLETKF